MADARRESRERRERYRVLRQLEDRLEMPMFVLSLLWVALLAVELIWGGSGRMQNAVTALWVIFVLEFILKFVIAPRKLIFLRKSWLTVFALALPALRVFRVARVVHVLRAGRAVRGLTLARVLTTFNRGLGSLRSTMGRFGFGYVLMLTVLVTVLGAAGTFAFERRQAGGSLETFADALWFTGMLMTTSGSDYWPQTAEGRVLCLLLALYAFAIFGYVTATLATLLVGQEAEARRNTSAELQTLEALRVEIGRLHERLSAAGIPER